MPRLCCNPLVRRLLASRHWLDKPNRRQHDLALPWTGKTEMNLRLRPAEGSQPAPTGLPPILWIAGLMAYVAVIELAFRP